MASLLHHLNDERGGLNGREDKEINSVLQNHVEHHRRRGAAGAAGGLGGEHEVIARAQPGGDDRACLAGPASQSSYPQAAGSARRSAAVNTSSRMEWDMTMVTVPPPRTGPVFMVASLAVSTVATCWLLAWSRLSWSCMLPLLTPRNTATPATAAAAAARASRIRTRRRAGPGRAAVGGGARGGCCLVAATAAITRSFIAGGGEAAVAAASRAVASRSPATSRLHSSHPARWRSNRTRSGSEIASIAYGPARVWASRSGRLIRTPPGSLVAGSARPASGS